ncbi:L-gulonate 5-dehydrogenase [Evansella caseinilytica]|uniref:L-gulonate 5-dehydrogenase n=1 Tax=Evansella caseinilytica TaxID=1503961 RepID=A0A1H3HU61_9BACI|nr:zinc-binding alcohol dehydrogenase family protein [Evansella caseinilytica]SDY18962.1 L-gulonate 5-dehydrogenase [Evansella caseinilytica]
MKAIQIYQPNDLRIIDVEKPEIKAPNEVLVKMLAAGICGSDVGIYHGTNAAATYPRVIGHELIGQVVKVGEDVTSVKKGDRTVINQVVACGNCYPCSIGRGNVCENLKVRGVHIDGGFTEYIVVPETDLFILPEEISNVDAVMIEPTSIGLQVCSRAELAEEDTLLIFGAGALGSTILKIARTITDKIIVADIVPGKLETALKNGAQAVINLHSDDLYEKISEYTAGRGVSVSMDAVCSRDSLMQLMKITGNAGRVMALGFNTQPIEINQFLIASKELDIRGSRLQNHKFSEAIELIKAGKLDFTGEVSHTFKLEEAQKAFDFIESRDPLLRKVALVID